MTFHQQSGCRNGFTRTELLFTIGAMLLVFAVLLAVPRWRAHQKLSQCKDNLKNLGGAWHLWLEDNDTIKPPWRTPINEKGTLGFEPAVRRGECWFQMMVFSNQLRSPKFLVDPAERGTRRAATWDANAASGFAAPQFQDQACSYAMALDYAFAGLTHWEAIGGPIGTMLFVDRHLEGNTAIEACSEGLTATALKQPFALRWSRQVHGRKTGNFVLVDGSVDCKAAETLKDILPVDFRTPGRSAHFLSPRRSSTPALKSH